MEKKEIIEQSKQFDNKINDIKTSFFSALDDFKKYYVYFHKNPEADEFQSYYSNSISQLQSMSKEIFMITNSIDKHIESLDDELGSATKKLENEKKINKEMMATLKNLQNTKNGSEILIDDSKKEYNVQYYKNVELIIGIILVSRLLATLFKNK
jgi:hypothetical protein